ncbi:FtsW/RodA/SpoVE family cell cycle protein [Gudongella oleilytica]|jgi:cell division protein FtsW (lipid II flippase)|uniref:FtsW/RodA/SpoVE family cell cycle protein n=1 Tax=Gudongella oleilytica TaxID=1582259 RepID=UPI002A35D04A|nr:FtsW/RodA/SpoVE family cell cycle protein [Gudongella oleilytica]MDY0257023.1 FtsW/RodA/SpoVE family cell cycle protein [Gudongella oleilytica]
MKNLVDGRLPRRLLLLFELMSMSLILLYRRDSLDIKIVALAIGLLVVVYGANYILSRLSDGDLYIFLIVSMLMSIGIIMIFRISSDLGLKQLLWLVIGIGAFFGSYFMITKLSFWESLFPVYIAAAYSFFAMTLILGDRKHGAINWISIGGISFQPAEMTKIILVFILACFFSGRDKFSRYKYADYWMMGVIYSFIGLLFIQRDLGTAMIFMGIFTGLQYIYSNDRKVIRANIGLFTIGGIAAYILFDHVKVRIMTWLNPWPYIDNKGYQITQSLFAIAEGSYFGTGLGRGNPSFIPLSYNDFIFSSITEEMGVFTGIGIIMLFMILVYRGFKIALRQDSKFYRMLALGITLMFGLQSFVIIGGVTKVIPLTGLTLPFVSYGGTSVLSSFIALGILQGASEKLTREEIR